MKLTIKTENGQKVVDLKNDLQFSTSSGEQYIFSSGFSNYVLSFKDDQTSVVLTFINSKSYPTSAKNNVETIFFILSKSFDLNNEIENLKKAFGDKSILNGINLDVAQGEVLVK